MLKKFGYICLFLAFLMACLGAEFYPVGIDTTSGVRGLARETDTIATGISGSYIIDVSSIDHGGLGGLADDDHTQYHNDSRALTWLGTRSTTDLPEGTNLYFTTARAQAAITAGNGISISSGQVSTDETYAHVWTALHKWYYDASTYTSITANASPTFHLQDGTPYVEISGGLVSISNDVGAPAVLNFYPGINFKENGTTALTIDTSENVAVPNGDFSVSYAHTAYFTGAITQSGGYGYTLTGTGTISGGATQTGGSFTTEGLLSPSLEAVDANGLELYDDGGNGIFVEDGGQVGIGTTAPGYDLQILNTSVAQISGVRNNSDNAQFYVSGDTSTGDRVATVGFIGNNTAGGKLYFYTRIASGANTLRWIIGPGGHIYPNTNNSYDLGLQTTNEVRNQYVVNAETVSSDVNRKENITEITKGIGVINALTPVSYTWKDDSSTHPLKHFGLTAQALRDVMVAKGIDPADHALVSFRNGEPSGIVYTELVPILVKAIQQQDAKISALETQVTDLNTRLQVIEARMALAERNIFGIEPSN